MTSGRHLPGKQYLHQYYAEQQDDEQRWYAQSGSPHKSRNRLDLMRAIWSSLGPESQRVLDVGCGDAYAVEQIFGARLPAAYVGVDLSPHKLRRVLGRFPPPRGSVAQADAEHLPLADECVDCILCINMLEHVPSPMAALSGIRQVLRIGGLAVLAVPVESPLQRRWYAVRGEPEPSESAEFIEHIRTFTTRDLLDLAHCNGFAVLRKIHRGFRFPLWDALSGRIPYRAFTALERWLCWIPFDHFGVGGRRSRVRLDIGRGSIVLVLRRTS